MEIAEQAIRLQPRLGRAWLAFGNVLQQVRQIRPAVTALETAWRLLPEDADALLIETAMALSECYQAMDDRFRVSRWSAEALRRLPGLETVDPAMHHYWKGVILELVGDTLGAVCAYRNALRAQLTFPYRAGALAACDSAVPRCGIKVAG